MIGREAVAEQICSKFCSSVFVNPVPCGLAVCTMFMDTWGDPIEFYVVEAGDGIRLEDSGEYLSLLIALGIAVDKEPSSSALDAILKKGGAFWNRDTYEIHSESFDESQLGERIEGFLSALIRVRALEHLAQDTARSTIRDIQS